MPSHRRRDAAQLSHHRDFRKIHRAAFTPLFVEVLRLASEMGLVRLGNLFTDGTKMKANASRHKAMSYGYSMLTDIARLEEAIEHLLKQAEQTDADQDARLAIRRGDERPAELKRREDRLAKIREAEVISRFARRDNSHTVRAEQFFD